MRSSAGDSRLRSSAALIEELIGNSGDSRQGDTAAAAIVLRDSSFNLLGALRFARSPRRRWPRAQTRYLLNSEGRSASPRKARAGTQERKIHTRQGPSRSFLRAAERPHPAEVRLWRISDQAVPRYSKRPRISSRVAAVNIEVRSSSIVSKIGRLLEHRRYEIFVIRDAKIDDVVVPIRRSRRRGQPSARRQAVHFPTM